MASGARFAPIPSVSATHAVCEALCARFRAARRCGTVLKSVLSIGLGSVDCDGQLAIAASKIVGTERYVVVAPAKYFGRVMERHGAAVGVLEQVDSIEELLPPAANEEAGVAAPSSTAATGAPSGVAGAEGSGSSSGPAGGGGGGALFDLILLPAWDTSVIPVAGGNASCVGTGVAAASAPSPSFVLSVAARLLAPGGTLLVLSFDTSGGAFRVRNGVNADGTILPSPRTSTGGGHAASASAGSAGSNASASSTSSLSAAFGSHISSLFARFPGLSAASGIAAGGGAVPAAGEGATTASGAFTALGASLGDASPLSPSAHTPSTFCRVHSFGREAAVHGSDGATAAAAAAGAAMTAVAGAGDGTGSSCSTASASGLPAPCSAACPVCRASGVAGSAAPVVSVDGVLSFPALRKTLKALAASSLVVAQKAAEVAGAAEAAGGVVSSIAGTSSGGGDECMAGQRAAVAVHYQQQAVRFSTYTERLDAAVDLTDVLGHGPDAAAATLSTAGGTGSSSTAASMQAAACRRALVEIAGADAAFRIWSPVAAPGGVVSSSSAAPGSAAAVASLVSTSAGTLSVSAAGRMEFDHITAALTAISLYNVRPQATGSGGASSAAAGFGGPRPRPIVVHTPLLVTHVVASALDVVPPPRAPLAQASESTVGAGVAADAPVLLQTHVSASGTDVFTTHISVPGGAPAMATSSSMSTVSITAADGSSVSATHASRSDTTVGAATTASVTHDSDTLMARTASGRLSLHASTTTVATTSSSAGGVLRQGLSDDDDDDDGDDDPFGASGSSGTHSVAAGGGAFASLASQALGMVATLWGAEAAPQGRHPSAGDEASVAATGGVVGSASSSSSKSVSGGFFSPTALRAAAAAERYYSRLPRPVRDGMATSPAMLPPLALPPMAVLHATPGYHSWLQDGITVFKLRTLAELRRGKWDGSTSTTPCQSGDSTSAFFTPACGPTPPSGFAPGVGMAASSYPRRPFGSVPLGAFNASSSSAPVASADEATSGACGAPLAAPSTVGSFDSETEAYHSLRTTLAAATELGPAAVAAANESPHTRSTAATTFRSIATVDSWFPLGAPQHSLLPTSLAATVSSAKQSTAATGGSEIGKLGAGSFFNAGLARWFDQRAAWSYRPPGFTHPPYPPMFDLDDYIDELSDITREVILPGPVRLPDIIDMYQDVWSPITEDSDSDPDW